MPKSTRLTVNLIGLDCASCERAIRDAVKDAEGVERVVPAPLLDKIFLYVTNEADIEDLKRRIAKTGKRITISVG